MKIFKQLLIFNITLAMIMILTIEIFKNNAYSESNFNKRAPIKIGVFLHSYNEYLSLVKQNLENIQKENKDDVEFTFFDAKENQTIQNESIDKALKENFDLLIVNLQTTKLDEVKDTLYKIMKKNIPLILFTEPNENLIKVVKPYGVIIATSGEQAGILEGKILADEWNAHKESMDKNHDGILQYIMLKGITNNPVVDARTKYSILTLNEAGINTEELASVCAEWNKDLAKRTIEHLFLKYDNTIEAIISNNDSMAIGAIEALQEYGYNKGDKLTTIPVVGIDGIDAAKELIQKGFMTGTVIQNPHATAEALYKVGMNLASNRPPLENTSYKFDDTGAVIRLPYEEYKK